MFLACRLFFFFFFFCCYFRCSPHISTPQSQLSPFSPPSTRDVSNVAASWLTCLRYFQIGGSLAKLVYFTRELDSPDNGGRLNFINFETHRIDLCIEFIKELKEEHEKANGPAPDQLCVVATGGGAYKYYDKLKEALQVNIIREDEMECLITGMSRSVPTLGI